MNRAPLRGIFLLTLGATMAVLPFYHLIWLIWPSLHGSIGEQTIFRVLPFLILIAGFSLWFDFVRMKLLVPESSPSGRPVLRRFTNYFRFQIIIGIAIMILFPIFSTIFAIFGYTSSIWLVFSVEGFGCCLFIFGIIRALKGISSTNDNS